MIDRSKLSPAGEKTMVEIEAQLMELCKQLTASVQRMAKPSRREQRRARKARKNAYMWRTAGRRYWNRPWRGKSHDALSEPIGFYSRVYRHIDQRIFNEAHARIVYHLREPSGFVAMSRVAEGMSKERGLIRWLRIAAGALTDDMVSAFWAERNEEP